MSQDIRPPTDRQRLREALWSVYYHSVFGPPTREGDPRLRPAPLEPSIRVLLESWDEHDDMRRRSTLVQLARYARVDASFVESSAGGQLAGAVKELSTSVGVDPDRLQGAFARDRRILAEFLGQSGSPQFLPTSELQTIVYAEAATACDVVRRSLSCSLTAWPLWIRGTVKVRVPRTLDQLKLALDPQNWARCSDVFLETSVVDPEEPPAPGTSWRGLLRERVVIGAMELDNTLGIRSVVTAAKIRIDYELADNPRTVLGGVDGPGILTADSGYIEATPTDQAGWCDVTIEKVLRYGEDVFNMTAPAMLFLWLDDASQIGPCC